MKKMLTKSVSILLSVIMIVSLFTIIPASASAVSDEDLLEQLTAIYDGDGKVDIYDVASIQKSLAGTSGYINYGTLDKSSIAFRIADVDGDGKVDIFDASLIQKFLAGEVVPYDIGKNVIQ